uniref:Acyl-CoA binding domain containing 4 n=1 Tax=Coturnix japonica TaxID=93934 RepID=A0A8C2UBU6_COTJA
MGWDNGAMADPGCGAQFQAAVRVIQGLPRSGSYRPSYEEMLRFYSYYKQATAGRCQEPRPGFWDPIGRYKWDAWHSLGRMSREEAMAAYVAEMKKVAQKVTGAAGGRLRSHVPSRRRCLCFIAGAGPAPAADTHQGSQGTSDSEGEVFSDPMEQMEHQQVTSPGLCWAVMGSRYPQPPHPCRRCHRLLTAFLAAVTPPELPGGVGRASRRSEVAVLSVSGRAAAGGAGAGPKERPGRVRGWAGGAG